jgi:23S rRNA (uracil1939-C5)-methyltransferase
MTKVELNIENLDHYARGIARLDGKTVFVENALPKEVVIANITKEKKNFDEGEAIEILKKSSDRIKPICPYYDDCGGCNIMHLNYDNQLKFKENKVKEVLKKFCDYDNVKEIIGTNNLYYRNKITLQVKEKIGYYKKKSYELVEIDKCFIVDEKINNIIKKLKNIDLSNINKIVIRTTKNETMIVFYSKKIVKLNINIFSFVDTIICITDKEIILKGKGYIEETINDIKFVISPTSFFQVNTNGMINLYDKVLEYCELSGNENLLDLYCGTGTIGIYLSKYCGKVFGVEINKEAIKDALKNKQINNLTNIDFKSGDVKEILKNNKFIPDIIVVDPPRAGLDKNVIDQIISLNPKKLIYVSCDVITLSRDLNLLKQHFDIKEVTPVDMFPNTYHVESVCVLNKR